MIKLKEKVVKMATLSVAHLKKVIEWLSVLLVVYIIGLLLYLFMWGLRILGRIKVTNPDRLPSFRRNPELFEKGFIVVANHPSLIDPLLISILMGYLYLSHPFRFIPHNMAEEKNYRNWFWRSWAKKAIIWIKRGSSSSMRNALRETKELLVERKGLLMIHPEGGRTEGGKTSPKMGWLKSKTGRKIRPLGNGIGWIAENTGAPVLLIWIDGSQRIMPNRTNKFYSFPRLWRKMRIEVGSTFTFDGDPANLITTKISLALLDLADELERPH
jgi:1-acyl-sn-glycerol-3-phosphate acyltransferase